MLKALLFVRLRSMAASFTSGKKSAKSSRGATLIIALVFLYVGITACALFSLLFHSLAEPYHALGLDWLYFSTAAILSFTFSILMGIYPTQSELYDAKDNDLLLSLPIPPRHILFSRLLPLFAVDVLTVSIIMVPAIVIYSIFVQFSFLHLLMQILAILGIALLTKAVSGFLGWVLHLLLKKLNKSVASIAFLLLFLAAYYLIYSNASDILASFLEHPQSLSTIFTTWIWPIYAIGQGCVGDLAMFGAFMAISLAAIALLYLALSKTFLRFATMSQRSAKAQQLQLGQLQVNSAVSAILRKELRKFLSTPVYLVNTGFGILLMVIFPVAAFILQDKIEFLFEVAPFLTNYRPLFPCAILGFLISTCCISAPSVSLEGKCLWILQGLPLPPLTILRGKLLCHVLLTAPMAALSSIALGISFQNSIPEIVLCMIVSSLFCLANGLTGMITGLKWAQFDFINETYPVKQSSYVLVTMMSSMGFLLASGLVYIYLVGQWLSPAVFLTVIAIVLAAICIVLYRTLSHWGSKRFHQL